MSVAKRWRLILLVTFFSLLVILCLISLLATPPTKEEWLRRQSVLLSRVKITDEMVAAARPWRREVRPMAVEETSLEGECEVWMYSLHENHGVIPIGEDGAVYVVTHSFHDNECRIPVLMLLRAAFPPGRQPVADATMAVDPQGRLYTCEGHICGGLMLTSKKEVRSLQDFLETFSFDDEQNTWKPYAK